MFKKILIANRGEIACRVINTCRRLGIGTVAIYSESDAEALHVRLADESYCIGPAELNQSYLHIPRIIQAAKKSKADAIHPGYGFLSENRAFVHACQETGINFIGPSAEVMRLMGDKVVARRLAKEAGLPLVPGTEEEVDDVRAAKEARRIGFPLMVKAADGGGGIGIRRVDSPEELEQSLQRSRSLAQGAFGSNRMYLERLISPAAHIEVQIIADNHGHVLHLFERDCSMQRRNQKVIEESPAIRMALQQRQKLWKAAVSLVKYIGYTNAGTIEFLADKDGNFYFMEMNTRLQVEHPVTEMVTGLDLVELQIRVAADEPLPVSQDQVISRGHSIEVRLYPEDPSTLMPVVGTVTELNIPSENHVRLDSSLFEGYAVNPHYESMLGKLIVWGEDRDQSIRRMKSALESFYIVGLTTNIPTLLAALGTEEFHQGTHTTDLFPQVAAQLQTFTSTDETVREASEIINQALQQLVDQGETLGGGSQKTPPTPLNAWKIAARRESLRPPLPKGRTRPQW